MIEEREYKAIHFKKRFTSHLHPLMWHCEVQFQQRSVPLIRTVTFFLAIFLMGTWPSYSQVLTERERIMVLKKIENDWKQKLPMKLDDTTTVVNVITTDSSIIYRYKMNILKKDLDPTVSKKQGILLINNWCSTMPILLKNGVIVGGVYSDIEGYVMMNLTVTKSDCNF